MIAVYYTSGDPSLAAKATNQLAEVYLDWQRQAKLGHTKDATARLSAQIDELRGKVSEAEAAVEEFHSSHGLFEGSNNVTLCSTAFRVEQSAHPGEGPTIRGRSARV